MRYNQQELIFAPQKETVCWVSRLAKLNRLWSTYWDRSRGNEIRNLQGFCSCFSVSNNNCPLLGTMMGNSLSVLLKPSCLMQQELTAVDSYPTLPQWALRDCTYCLLLWFPVPVVYHLGITHWHMNIKGLSVVSNSRLFFHVTHWETPTPCFCSLFYTSSMVTGWTGLSRHLSLPPPWAV